LNPPEITLLNLIRFEDFKTMTIDKFNLLLFQAVKEKNKKSGVS